MSASKKLSALAAILLAGLAIKAFAGNALVFGNVSGWTVYTDPEQAYSCFAEVEYEGGTLVRIGEDAEVDGLYLSITDPAWRGIVARQEHAARLSFDDAGESTATGTGLANASRGTGGIRLHLSAESREAFVSEFRASHTLTITIAGQQPLDLSLAGSLRATDMLRDCESSMSRHRNAAP